MAKLLSELDVVRRNVDIMNEIMTENEPGKENADDYQLLEVSTVMATPMYAPMTMYFPHFTRSLYCLSPFPSLLRS